jgi:hypothetical protein
LAALQTGRHQERDEFYLRAVMGARQAPRKECEFAGLHLLRKIGTSL